MQRREFIAASVAGALAAGGLARAQFTGQPAGKPKRTLRKAVMYGMIAGDMPVLDKFKLLKDCGFEGVEMDSPNPSMKPNDVLMAQSQTPILLSDAQEPGSAILWTLDSKGLNPVRVRTGLSDETHTEVSGENLKPGTKVVIGVADPRSLDDGASKNPFQNPRPTGGDKGG